MANLLYLSQYFTTELAVVGGIDDSQTTGIVLQSVTGIDNTAKPGLALLNYSDPLNESICEWVTFDSINSTTKTLVGVTRGAEKGSAKPHDNGVTIAFPISEAHINRINDKLTGVDSIDGATINTSTLVTPIVKTNHAIGVAGATETINWANGDHQTITLDENITITFSNAVAGQTLTLYILQDGTGTNTITWADTIIWQDAATWGTSMYSTTADKWSVVVIHCVATNVYLGMAGKFA